MKTFNYNPGNPIPGKLPRLGIAIIMIVLPLIVPFGIRIGRMRILEPAAVAAILLVGGIALLIYTLLQIHKERVLHAKQCPITVDGDRVTYPAVRGETVEKRAFRISEIEYTRYDEEEKELSVSLPEDLLVFRSDFFDSPDDYKAFADLLGEGNKFKNRNQNR